MWLFVIFVAVPIVEIALFIQVGGLIGLWPTLLLVLLTAVAGSILMRAQGLQALARLRGALAAGQDPTAPMAHGAMILIAGVLLLTPGFFTDALGLSLLLPPVRAALIRRAAGRLSARMFAFAGPGPEPRRPAATDTLDGEYEVLDDVPPSQRGASGWTRPQR